MNKQETNKISTGFEMLDSALNAGFSNGDLVILGARPSMGKTSLALNIAANIGLNLKKPVLVFSLEMSTEQLTRRLISINSSISLGNLQKGNLNKQECEKATSTMKEVSNSKIYIDDTNCLSIDDISSKIKDLKLVENDLALVIVDYLQLIKRPNQARYFEEIENVLIGLKNLANELKVPILCQSQISRELEMREDKRPSCLDLAPHKAIEKLADIILLLYRDDYYTPIENSATSEAEIIIAKNKNASKISSVKLSFFKDIIKFEDIRNT